ncbi:hypothetical protein CcaCcLH18_14246 [Colletotrichum camelliae]|nr:hypothetical protein CcaCcLH18_14246 [Colletotrichum camelliae]
MDTSQQFAVIADAAVAVAIVALIDDIINEPGPQVIRQPGGTEWASESAASLLCGERDNFHQMFRVSKRNFMNIVAWLQHHTFVKDTRYQSSEHKLMIGLYIPGQGARQRTTSNKFQVAQSTVSEIYQQVLTGLVSLHDEVVKQPDASNVSPQIELKDKYGCFTGCIGAIDGTLLPAHVPARMKKRFIGRKGQPQQNVLCAIRFDGIFTYVLAGAEGSMNDAALMRQARSRSFNPPAGRYYLEDAGFACERGILTPFLGERYHQAETRAYIDATSAKEAYNILHAEIKSECYMQ